MDMLKTRENTTYAIINNHDSLTQAIFGEDSMGMAATITELERLDDKMSSLSSLMREHTAILNEMRDLNPQSREYIDKNTKRLSLWKEIIRLR